MKRNILITSVMFSTLSFLIPAVLAAEPQDPWAGDWRLVSDFNGRPANSLLMLTKDADGYKANWVNFWGISAAEELKIEDGKISFTLTNRFRDQEFSTDITGTLEDGKLTGTMSSDQWDSNFEGRRIKPLPPVVGVWEFRRQRQEREFVSTLTVSGTEKDGFTVDWQSRSTNADEADNADGEWEISDVKYEDGKLSFTRKRTDADSQRQTTYALSAADETISGTMTTSRGERELEGKRVNGSLVGKWILTVTSEGGPRRQLLWIQPDMTALYGSTDVGKITVEDGTVSFDYEVSFGERSFENAFKGKLEDGALTGEMTNSRGTQQVKGQKMTSLVK